MAKRTPKEYDLAQLLSHPLTLKDLGVAIVHAEAALARDKLECIDVRFDVRVDLSGAPWQMYVRAKKPPRRRA